MHFRQWSWTNFLWSKKTGNASCHTKAVCGQASLTKVLDLIELHADSHDQPQHVLMLERFYKEEGGGGGGGWQGRPLEESWTETSQRS